MELLPLPVTSLIPVALFPILGIMDTGAVSVEYLNKTCMLFVGGKKIFKCIYFLKIPIQLSFNFHWLVKKFNEKLEEERLEAAQMTNKSSESGKNKVGTEWETEELQLLIKSVNLFPAGTVNR